MMNNQPDHKIQNQSNRFEEEFLSDDRRALMFATLAQRHCKQRGFLKGGDVLDSLDSDKEFIESLNIPSFESLAKSQEQ